MLLQGIPREDYWIETKLHPRDLGFESTLAAFPRSLVALNTSYIDLFLLHFPRCYPSMCSSSPGTFQDSWRALEKLYREGVVKAIGVSNFDTNDLTALLEVAEIKPHVVQNFFDPLHQDRAVREICSKEKIIYQGYSTLGTQWVMKRGNNPVLTHPVITSLALAHQRSPAQLILNWALNRGVAVIPRSTTKENIRQNADIEFTIEETDLRQIDLLDGMHDSEETSIDVTFVNSDQVPVKVFWRGPAHLKHVADLVPGETLRSRSYDGHSFVVHVDGEEKYSFDVSSSYPVYHLESSAVRPHHEL